MNRKEQRMKLWCDVYLHYKKTGNTVPHVKANEALKDFDNTFKEDKREVVTTNTNTVLGDKAYSISDRHTSSYIDAEAFVKKVDRIVRNCKMRGWN